MNRFDATLGRCWDDTSCLWFDAAADVGLAFAALFAVLFAFSYILGFKWRATPEGRTFAYLVLSLLGTYILNSLGNFYDGDYWFREPLRVLIYWSVAGTFARFFYLLWWGSDDLNINASRRQSREEKRKK